MLRLSAIAILAATAATAPPPAPWEMYNRGLQKMRSNDLVEAESELINAAKSNEPSVQPLAVYNLGHVRFLAGKDILSGQGNRQQIIGNADAAFAVAGEALRSAKSALLDETDLRGLVEAYNEAKEARKGLRGPRDETSRATSLVGSALVQWRKSADGFSSAFELDPANEDAKYNAGVMQKYIDELIQFNKKLQQQSEQISEQRKELGKAMKELRGKIPKEMQRESDQEEDEDDDDEEQEQKKDQKPGQQQQQRLGTGREIDRDMMEMLKERITPRTMSPDGEKPGRPQRRPGRDW